jgi:hypothetical protein
MPRSPSWLARKAYAREHGITDGLAQTLIDKGVLTAIEENGRVYIYNDKSVQERVDKLEMALRKQNKLLMKLSDHLGVDVRAKTQP